MIVTTLCVIFIILFLIVKFSSSSNPNAELNLKRRTANNQFISKLISIFSNEDQEAIWKFINKLRDGEEMSYDDVEAFKLLQKKIKPQIPEDSEVDWLITSIASDLYLYAGTFYNPNSNLEEIVDKISASEVFEKYNINLDSNEICYLTGKINFFEEKTVSRQVSYGGISTRTGPFKIGNMTYTVTPIKKLVLVGFGRFFITNKKVLFIQDGTNNIKQIKLNNIISYEIFKDSILLHTANNKKPMFLQIENDSTKPNQGVHIYDLTPYNILIGFLLRKLLN